MPVSSTRVSRTSHAQRTPKVAHVVLGLFEQRPERLGNVGQPERLRLLEPFPVAGELALLELEVRRDRPSGICLARHLGDTRRRDPTEGRSGGYVTGLGLGGIRRRARRAFP